MYVCPTLTSTHTNINKVHIYDHKKDSYVIKLNFYCPSRVMYVLMQTKINTSP